MPSAYEGVRRRQRIRRRQSGYADAGRGMSDEQYSDEQYRDEQYPDEQCRRVIYVGRDI